MRHAGLEHRPKIEIIDGPNHASALKKAYPYLDVQSILEIESIGSNLINELTGKAPRRFQDFEEDEQLDILRIVGNNRNWFALWLTQMVEHHSIEGGDISTTKGVVAKFLDAQ